MPNCHTPLGYVLPDEVKKATVEIAAQHGVALIENDVYRDLAFGIAGRSRQRRSTRPEPWCCAHHFRKYWDPASAWEGERREIQFADLRV